MISLLKAELGAQTLKGKVTDKNNLPLFGVNVSLKQSEYHAHTNEQGKFELRLATTDDTLMVEHFGYKTREISLSSLSLSDSLVFQLQETVFELSEIVIDKNIKALSVTSEIDVQTNPVSSSQELLRTVPGLIIGQHAGGGKAEQLFLRGFDIDHGTDINITVDNMPVNMVSHAHGQGYADMHFIIPETIEKIDFGKGSYYADKGNFTTAGYVGFQTKTHLDNNLSSVEIGQFNTQRVLSLFEVVDNHNEYAYAAIDYNSSNGWFDSPQNFHRLNLFSKYSIQSEGGSRTNITASHFTSSWDASGQIPVRAVNSGLITRFGAIDDTEGGNTSRTNLTVNTTKIIGQETQLTNFIYYSHYDFELYSNFTFFARDSVNGDQIRQKENRHLFGGESQLQHTYHFTPFDLKLTGAAGFRYDQINDIELSYTKNRVTTLEQVQLGDISETNAYSYFNADFDFGKWLINPAVRLDYFNFNYTNKLDSSYNSPSSQVVTASPKFNIVYQASPKFQAYLKNGIGFHSNDSRVVVQQGANKTLPLAYSSDLGVILKPASPLLIHAALWHLYLEQEFVYVGDEGIVEPSGRTQRYGVDVGFRYELIKGLFVFSDVSLAHARAMDEPEGSNYIPLAPPMTVSGGVTYKHASGLSGSVRFRGISDRPANEDNSLVAAGYFVTDFNVNYTLNHWQLGIVIQNVFNTEWKETQFATESRLVNEAVSTDEIHFTPGIPFALRGKLTYRF